MSNGDFGGFGSSPEEEMESLEGNEEKFQSPFGIEDVDPLVFAPLDPNALPPELRPGAQRIPVIQARPEAPLPTKAARRKYGEWVPGGRSTRVDDGPSEEDQGSKSVYRILKRSAGILAIALPFSAIAYVVYLVLHIYK